MATHQTTHRQRRNMTRIRRVLSRYALYRFFAGEWRRISAESYWVWRQWAKHAVCGDVRLAAVVLPQQPTTETPLTRSNG